ncbi:hypothetical protein ACLB2K_023958 [Fragaria x ananassa]
MPIYNPFVQPSINTIVSNLHPYQQRKLTIWLSPRPVYMSNMTQMDSYHNHALLPNQCGSTLVQIIDAPLPLVWSILRQFDNPQAYKLFIKSCTMRTGDGGVGSIREVMVSSGLPGKTSTERLDRLDDEKHVMNISILGGEHRLVNYRSTTTVHEEERYEDCCD